MADHHGITTATDVMCIASIPYYIMLLLPSSRPAAVTLPDLALDASFTSLWDVSFSNLETVCS